MEDSGEANKNSKVPDSTYGARPKTKLETIQEESGKEDETAVTNKSNEKESDGKEKTTSKKVSETKTKENNPEKMHVPPFQLDKIIPARAFNQYYDARKYNPADPAIMEG